MEATSKGFIELPVPSGVTLQGRTYHVLRPVHDTPETALWYLLDTQYRNNNAKIRSLIRQKKLPADFVSKIVEMVLESMNKLKNPFYQSLKATLDVSTTCVNGEDEQIQLIIHAQD